MNTLILQAGWNILKGKLKQTWALLTGDDLEFKEGKTREFLGRIQKKSGEKRAAIQRTKRECEELWEQIDPAPKGESCDNLPYRLRGARAGETCCAL